MFQTIDELKKGIEGVLQVAGNDVAVLNESRLRDEIIDNLIYTAVFCSDEDTKAAAQWLIRRAGVALGIISSSIQTLYDAMGRKEATGFTVPAINLRGITYYSAQAVFRAALKGKVGALIFEIARSEIGYTAQRPIEYTIAITAAAIKTGFTGPLFLQGDHFQINAKKFAQDPAAEVEGVKELIKEAVAGGFYNIDIDSSTVVDLSKPTIKEQQENNYAINAELTALIRSIEPKGITVSVGGEIGEVGGKNTTVEEFKIFMEGYLEELKKKGVKTGISKISIQTGTTHGGVPLPDGTIAQVKIDFDTLKNISEVARTDYGLSGAVQHGASTLPNEAFDKFPPTQTAEIHLATGFQNIIYDSENFPEDLKRKVYDYINTDLRGEKKDKDTEEQFIYKTRKKGFGLFKKEMWNLPSSVLAAIGTELENQFAFLFNKLNVNNTTDIVERFVKPADVPSEAPSVLR